MGNPKKHHFVPESYLAGFTLTNSKDGELWVLDQTKASIRSSTPHKEAYQRYLYKVEVSEGGDEFGVERGLADFESLAIPVLKELTKNTCIPTGEEYNILMNFLALQIVRTPKYRKNIKRIYSDVYEQIGKNAFKILTQSKEYFEKYLDGLLRRKPHLKREEFEYEKIKNGIDDFIIEADIDRNYHVKHSLDSIDNILPLLANRNWCIISSLNQSIHFITSDNPVVLTWSDPRNYGRPIGFGLMGTDVIFSINKSVAIIGRFESVSNNISISEEKMALINTCIANASDRFLYFCEKKVCWLKPNGKVGSLEQMVQFLRNNISQGKLKNS